MNKTELASAIAEKAALTKKQAAEVVDSFVSVVGDALAEGDKVQIMGFGTFEVRSRPARAARNPRTGEPIQIAASNAPAFKAGSLLKEKVNTPAKKKK